MEDSFGADKEKPISERGKPWVLVVGVIGLTISLLIQQLFFITELYIPLSIVGGIFACASGIGLRVYLQGAMRNIVSVLIIISGFVVFLIWKFKPEIIPFEYQNMVMLLGIFIALLGTGSYRQRARWF